MTALRKRSVDLRLILAWVIAAVVFALDLQIRLGIAAAVPYVIAIGVAYSSGSYRGTVQLAMATTLLTIVAFQFSPPGSSPPMTVVLNRCLAIMAIWGAALPCVQALRTSKKLSERLQESASLASMLEQQRVEDQRKRRVLANVLEDLHRERQQLARVATELALPPRGVNADEIRVDMHDFSLKDMINCSRAIRGFSRTATTEQEFAERLVDFLFRCVRDHDGCPQLELVQLYQSTEKLRVTDAATEQAAAAEAGTPAAAGSPDGPESARVTESAGVSKFSGVSDNEGRLRLRAMAGIGVGEPSAKSARDANAAALAEARQGDSDPMLSVEIITALGFENLIRDELESDPFDNSLFEFETGYFHLDAATAKDSVLSRSGFVVPDNVETLLGFGGSLSGDSMFMVIACANVPFSNTNARMLSHLANSARVGLAAFMDTTSRTVTQIRSIDRLLAHLEQIVRDQEAQLLQTMGALSDANERLQVANLELENFAYAASHDLRSPLRGIVQSAQFIREDDGERLSESSRRYLEKLELRVQRMQSLLDDLLTYSRIGRRQENLEAVNTGALLNEVCELLPIPDGFAVELPERSVSFVTFRTPLRQVLLNLISNAIKHHHREQGCIKISIDESPESLTFTVADDGPGIDPQYHERIFEIFQTLQSKDHTEGSGIGLAIVRKVIQQHGGEISVKSRVGGGSTFTFSWPTAGALAEATV